MAKQRGNYVPVSKVRDRLSPEVLKVVSYFEEKLPVNYEVKIDEISLNESNDKRFSGNIALSHLGVDAGYARIVHGKVVANPIRRGKDQSLDKVCDEARHISLS